MKRKIFSLFLCCVMLMSLMAVSSAEAAQEATAEAAGFGGTITVTLKVEDGKVVDAAIEGPSETEGKGSVAVEEMQAAMEAQGTVEVDGVSGATFSSQAILTAAREAYAKATGTEVSSEVKMAPGTYTGSATGFRQGHTIDVSVTVDEKEIKEIVVDHETLADTVGMFDSAEDLLIPRIIETQSVSVDAITGATSSSNGIKLAVTKALEQALEAGGSDAAAISAFQTVPAKSTATEELDVDILIVGMGGAGTVAAVRAAELAYEKDPENVNILAIDKAGRYGGMASLTMSVFAANPPKYIEENNNGEDYVDADALYEDWIQYTQGDAKADIVRNFIDDSGDVLDWMVYEHGLGIMPPAGGLAEGDSNIVCFNYADADKGLTIRRIGTLDFYDRMIEDYTAHGGKYMLETEGYELIMADDGVTVVGCKARNADGTEYIIHADAVIMATGGFAANPEMEEKYLSNEYYPLKGTWKMVGLEQNDGAMIEGAINAGAGTYNIGMPPMVHMSGSADFLTQFEYVETENYNGQTNQNTVWTYGDIPMYMGLQQNTLAVDANGARFTAETGIQMLDPWIAGPYYYSIYSGDMVAALRENGFKYPTMGVAANNLGAIGPIPNNMPLPQIDDVLDAAVKAGFVFKADSLEELASQFGADPETLKATVENYNTFCENGEDTEFGKAPEYLEKIGNEGPFYAIKMASYCYSTAGAMDINADMNVLAADGETVMNGLYATGLDSMGVMMTEKDAYVTYGGVAEGFAFVSGYRAAENAVAYVAGAEAAEAA